jgi:hypothetical protein
LLGMDADKVGFIPHWRKGNYDVTPIPVYGLPVGRNVGASAVYCWQAYRQAKTVQTLVCWTAR